ncbi:hypothetical protein POTOM_055639 [Populus tomentosa]|uniref:SCP domain-containing protein n=1 Tax=Populus tomentosa TaxID=118781 RepID=A0A8X8C5B8_POPTO|nr:hypothetical protein POTOM_055639 [Populus tomentosa]
MEVRALFSCRALGTFLLFFCSFPLLSVSDSTHENSPKLLSRRLLTTTPRNIVKQYLVPHNLERAKLGLPPLRWSKKLANFASSWAHRRREDCALIHSNSDYGENLFWGSGKDWKPGDAVATWAEEKGDYSYKTNRCAHNKDCLHYTQIVWRQSLKAKSPSESDKFAHNSSVRRQAFHFIRTEAFCSVAS